MMSLTENRFILSACIKNRKSRNPGNPEIPVESGNQIENQIDQKPSGNRNPESGIPESQSRNPGRESRMEIKIFCLPHRQDRRHQIRQPSRASGGVPSSMEFLLCLLALRRGGDPSPGVRPGSRGVLSFQIS